MARPGPGPNLLLHSPWKGSIHMLSAYVFMQCGLASLRGRFESKSKGATAVEYGIMVAAIAVVIIGAVFALGGSVKEMFNDVGAEISAHPTS